MRRGQPQPMKEQNYPNLPFEVDQENTHSHRTTETYLEIIEQPKSRGYRFRYECEGGSHGNIYGESTNRSKKVFPTVKIQNYSGTAQISVSLVTDENPPHIHTHELIGKDTKNGVCVVELKPGHTQASFPGLAIKHSTKKRAAEILQQRIMDSIRNNKLVQLMHANGQAQIPTNVEDIKIPDEEVQLAMAESEDLAKNINLSVVKLCFQAMLKDGHGKFFKTLPSVTSNPIYDAKSPGAAALKICRMDKSSGCCTGDEEVFLLCDKVQKEDISVCFQEVDEDGLIKWEDYGSFGPQDVHRQFAIVFRTPAYRDRSINGPITVYVKLKRMSKSEESNQVPFTYFPEQQDHEEIKRKRKKKLPDFSPKPDSQGGPGLSFMGGNTSGGDYSLGHKGSNQGYAGGQHRFGMDPQHVIIKGQPQPVPGAQAQPVCPVPQPQILQFAFPRKPETQPLRHTTASTISVSSATVVQPNMIPTGQNQHANYPFQHGATPQQPGPYMNQGGMIPSILLGRGGASSPKAGSTPPSTHKNKDRSRISTDSAPPDDGYCGSFQSSQASLNLSGPRRTNNIPSFSKIMDIKSSSCQTDTTPKATESSLAEQVVQLGDRLFKALQDYATTGDVGYLLLVQRHLVAQQDQNGDNIVHLAVLYKKYQVLQDLLKVISTLSESYIHDQPNILQQTPLHLAVLLRDAVMVDMLMSYQASIQLVDHKGNNPMHLAAKSKAPECMRILLTKSAQRGSKHKARGPVCTEVNTLNYQGMAPIHLAVLAGHLECVKVLIRYGRADVNMQEGKSGKTPLHLAVEQNELAILGYLCVDAEAEVNMSSYDGSTPLHTAIEYQLIGCTSVLVSAGADPDAERIETLPDSESDSCSDEDDENDDGAYDEKLSLKERMKSKEEKKEKQLELGEDVHSEDEDEEEDEDKDTEDKYVSVTPRLLAEGSKQLEQILNGEECTEPIKAPGTHRLIEHRVLDRDPVIGGTLQGATAAQLDTGLSEPLQTKDIGLSQLDSMARAQLGKLLDSSKPGHDWRQLAHELDLSSLVDVFHMIASPTRALLDNYEALDGSMDELRKALVKIERPDAVKVLDDVRSLRDRVKATGNRAHYTSYVKQLESNIASMKLQS